MRWGNGKHVGYTCGGGHELQVTDGGGGASNSGTNLALVSFWHQSWWGGSKRKPGLVACAVEPGTLDLVVTGQGGVTVPPMCERRLRWDFILVGNERSQRLSTWGGRLDWPPWKIKSGLREFHWTCSCSSTWPGWPHPFNEANYHQRHVQQLMR